MPRLPRTTTRSYLLGLLSPSDATDWLPLWNRLFRTHYVICRGAREYGELYLNLRGGLSASLAACLDEPDPERRRLLQRGARRMLALGWLSVESVRGAETHPYRIHDIRPGQSLTRELAGKLLRDILKLYKGVTNESELAGWVSDCALTLTARIRDDAVIVNRAAVFAEWQRESGEEALQIPEQAERILFAMCGDGFVSLSLGDDSETQASTDEETESADIDEDLPSRTKDGDSPQPNIASRRIHCNLFGGDPEPKIKREVEKRRFAAIFYEFLRPLDRENLPPLPDALRTELSLPTTDGCKVSEPITAQIAEWREKNGWHRRPQDLLPREASPDNKKNKIAMPYRKLLVAIGLWPESPNESGVISAVHEKKGLKVRKALAATGSAPADSDAILGISCAVLKACAKKLQEQDRRVFKPPWIAEIESKFDAATKMENMKGSSEFRYLMFALAARRISQTQTWTKRNEMERHKAALREDAARARLQELDGTGSAVAWLTHYELERGRRAEAESEFRITGRMIGECEAVFNSWKDIASVADRDEKTAAVQRDAEKFGDPTFYSDISADPTASVIRENPAGAEILKQWVKLRSAEYDQQRLKIPRFCHPDPFHHPTWCEFGGSSKPKIWYAWRPESKPESPEPGGNADGSRRLWLLLPDFAAKQAKAVPMRWRSKRLSRDLGGVTGAVDVPIPRADRVSVAAAQLPLRDGAGNLIRYRPQHPFSNDAKSWNARLQIDRESLEELEKQWDDARNVWRDGGKALRHVRWSVTFAPTLTPSEGPGRSVHQKLGWQSNPHSELNKKQKREGHAKLILSRLPGLRVLSVDLGHRFAAACAVWESLSIPVIKAETQGREIIAGGLEANDLFCHTRHKDRRGSVRTTIYRRIGSDKLVNGTEHPAPWARLDRQFFIKLQGEERPARAASKGKTKDGGPDGPDEVGLVARLAAELGIIHDEQGGKASRQVDELMRQALRIASLGLKRHGRYAKIAYAFNPECPGVPGMGGKLKEFTRGDEAHTHFLTDALMDWHALSVDTQWNGAIARALWNHHLSHLPNGFSLAEPERPDPNAERPTRQQRRNSEEELRERLKPIAGHLVKASRSLTASISDAWRKLWDEAEGVERTTDDFVHALIRDDKGNVISSRTTPKKGMESPGGWYQRLRVITDWVMGRRLEGAPSEMWTRNVGGLSLTRIATMKSLYQLHKAFAMRPRPNELRGAPKKGQSNVGLAQSILDALEEMRKQRVKQIASRIVEAALGVGIEQPRVWDDVKKRWRYRKRPQGLLNQEDGDAKKHGERFKTCHAVVIENLRNYRPDELRTRRENRSLMNWSSGKVRKYLEEACQLHGLHLREVVPNYTSRQDSRTGMPGCRCDDIPVAEFLFMPWWRKAVSRAKERKKSPTKEKPFDAESQLLIALDEQWPDLKAVSELEREAYIKNIKSAKPIRLISKGGDLFVAVPPSSCKSSRHESCPLCSNKRALQSDLNAAANIGLRALLDPDFIGKWWYVPCDAKTGRPAEDKCKGAACLDLERKLVEPPEKLKGSKEKINAWRSFYADDDWRESKSYWNAVRAEVVAIMRKLNVPKN